MAAAAAARRAASPLLLAARRASSPLLLAGRRSALSSAASPPLLVATETSSPLTPQLQRVLHRMEKASFMRHEDIMTELGDFELELMKTYAAAKVSAAEPALNAGKISWRVSSAVLAFGVTTLVAVLQTVKDGWKLEFQAEVDRFLQDLYPNLKSEMIFACRLLVRREVKLIQAERAVSSSK